MTNQEFQEKLDKILNRLFKISSGEAVGTHEEVEAIGLLLDRLEILPPATSPDLLLKDAYRMHAEKFHEVEKLKKEIEELKKVNEFFRYEADRLYNENRKADDQSRAIANKRIQMSMGSAMPFESSLKDASGIYDQIAASVNAVPKTSVAEALVRLVRKLGSTISVRAHQRSGAPQLHIFPALDESSVVLAIARHKDEIIRLLSERDV